MSDTTSLDRISVRDRSTEAGQQLGSKVSVKVRFLPPRLLPYFLRPLTSKLTNSLRANRNELAIFKYPNYSQEFVVAYLKSTRNRVMKNILSQDRIPVGGKIFRTRPDRPWGSPSLLYNG